MARRMLVVHMGGLGDFLLCCPALECLARDFVLELLGRPARLELAIAGGIAEKAHNIESSGFESLFVAPDDTIRALLAQFDAAVVWMRDEDGALKRAIQSCGVPDVRAFPGLPPENWSRHASEYYLEQLGLSDSKPFRLALSRKKDGGDVVIQPGSGSERKNWPLERFITLAETLESRGRPVHWCVGPAEAGMTLPENARVFSPDSPIGLARWLSEARAYVGNDSGVTHLAAACGVRTTAIFGPTNPWVWAPIGANVQVLHGDPWPSEQAVVESVWESLQEA